MENELTCPRGIRLGSKGGKGGWREGCWRWMKRGVGDERGKSFEDTRKWGRRREGGWGWMRELLGVGGDLIEEEDEAEN